MKALTVKNPWAWLITQGIKDIENRTWQTKFRGRILIHAAAGDIPLTRFQNNLTTHQRQEVKKILTAGKFPFGNSQILCSVEIVDCVMNHPSIWAEKGKDDRGKQIWNWVLANPEPVPEYEGLKIKGSLSFWEMTDDRIIKP